MPDPILRPARWWIGFTDSPARHWYSYFTRPGFRHCYCFREVAGDVVQLVNPLIHCVDVRIGVARACHQIAKERAAGARILTILTNPDVTRPPRRGHLMTCASLCAYVIGLDTRAITPYGLWRAVLAAGGEEITD